MARYKVVRLILFVVFTAAAFLGFGRFYEDYASQAVNNYCSQLASSFVGTGDVSPAEYDNLCKESRVNRAGEETSGIFDVPVTVIAEDIDTPYYYMYEGDELVGLAEVPFASGVIDGIYYDYEFFGYDKYYITKYFIEDGIYHAVEAEYIEDFTEKKCAVVLTTDYTDEQLSSAVSGRIEISKDLKHAKNADRIKKLKAASASAGSILGMPVIVDVKYDYNCKTFTCQTSYGSAELKVTVGLYYKTSGVKLLFLVIAIVADVIILAVWSKIEDKNAKKAYAAYLADDYNRKCINALAHDVKSSLMVISTSAENMVAGYEESKKKVFEEEIASEVDKLDDLIKKLGQYVSTSDIKGDIAEDVDISSMVEACVGRYKSFAEKRDLSFRLEKKNALVIRADARLMEMVFDNFVYNAVKYASEGTDIEISVDERGFKIYNRWEPIDKYIDNPELFFKAYEVGSQERSYKNGSGVGLAIAANVLDYYKIKYQARTDREGVSFEVIR